MDKATANGLKAARRIADELELDGFYGPLYELFTVSDAYRTAAEVTAGNSLFHVVVDSDETASRILEAMASGLAIVSCRAVGVTDCLRDRENGLLVEPADVSAQAVVNENAGKRPIYLAEALDWAADALTPAPPLWRYEP